MINQLLNSLFKKQIILYEKHRHISPIINTINKQDYFFIPLKNVWILFSFFGRGKLRSKVFYVFLKIVNPKFILSVNWISKRQILYYLWAKINNKDFIVVQHGSYVGGKITDNAHKYARCTKMLCWSEYFKLTFEENNIGKKVRFINFGNSVYNCLNRPKEYKEYKKTESILLLPTFMNDDDVFKDYLFFIKKLKKLNYKVTIKQHNFQIKNKPINGFNSINGNIYKLLSERNFDLIISDHSSALLDAIFFKNRVLYYNTSKKNMSNIYSDYFHNLSELELNNLTNNTLESFLNISKQEELFEKLANGHTKNNKLI